MKQLNCYVLETRGKVVDRYSSFRVAYKAARSMKFERVWPPNPTARDTRWDRGVLFYEKTATGTREVARIHWEGSE